jgi:hypothetical protein
MNQLRRIVCAALVCALCGWQLSAPAAAQRQRTPTRRAPTPRTRTTTTTARTQTTTARTRTPPPRTPKTTRRASPAPASTAVADARLTGIYQIDPAASDEPQAAAARVMNNLPPSTQQDVIERLLPRLTSPTLLTLQRRGRVIDIASTRAPRITFTADGQTHTERAADGRLVSTRAALSGDNLTISSRGSAEDEFSVTFAPIENGRRLRVSRYIYDARLSRPVFVQTIYDKTAGLARFDIYGQPEASMTSARNTRRNPQRTEPPVVARNRTPQSAPVMRPRVPPPARNELPPARVEPRPVNTVFTIGRNTQFVATLNDDLSTTRTRPGDRFTMTVRAPEQFAGATLEGTVARVERAGPFSGRAELALTFERIRLTDGRTAEFAGTVEEVRTGAGEEARVDPEGGGEVQERNSQTDRTVERAAIGAAVGAIIGAIAKGGKGAAIGAAIGAGAGAGSVYVQGRDDLELPRGTEVILRGNTTDQ